MVSIELTYNHIRVLEDEPQVPAWNNVKSYQFERVKVVKIIIWLHLVVFFPLVCNHSSMPQFFPTDLFMGIDLFPVETNF